MQQSRGRRAGQEWRQCAFGDRGRRRVSRDRTGAFLGHLKSALGDGVWIKWIDTECEGTRRHGHFRAQHLALGQPQPEMSQCDPGVL